MAHFSSPEVTSDVISDQKVKNVEPEVDIMSLETLGRTAFKIVEFA